MSMQGHRLRKTIALLAFALASLIAGAAPAQGTDSGRREAAKHFQRGVVLYGDGDYRAALVEFNRAVVLAPNSSVLYNIGEAEYQLQDYAGALTTFRRYLVESSPAESHRPEVESSVEVLRARVGHVGIMTDPPGADVMIDERSVGKTPLDEPVLVSIGRRRILASMPGRAREIRYVDVAAEDNISLTLSLPRADQSLIAAGATMPSSVPRGSRDSGSPLRLVGWIATAALTGGAVTFGLLADKEATDLRDARSTSPTRTDILSHDAGLTTTYWIAAASLTAGAIVLGGVTLFSTLSSPSSTAPRQGIRKTRITISGTLARFEMAF